jgi:hypothetical protein
MGFNDSTETSGDDSSPAASDDAQAKGGRGRRWGKYAIGAGLVLAICVLIGGSSFSNDFWTIIQVGLVIGPFIFLFLGPAHFALQFVARRGVSRFWRPGKLIEGMIVNLPASVICAYLLVALAAPSPQSRMRQNLQAHFELPLPASVSVQSYQMGRGMTEGTYLFVFSINSLELTQFLSNSGCILLSPDSAEADLAMLKVKFPSMVRAGANIEWPPQAIYQSETNRGVVKYTKTIFVHSNETEVVFCEEFH